MWQEVLDRPDRSAEVGRRLAELQLALFELVAPVDAPAPARPPGQQDPRGGREGRSRARAGARALIPERAGRLRLCHGDLHPSNVILSPDGPVIVDWYDASRGDAVADVARSCLMLLGDGGAGPRHLPGASRAVLDALERGYLGRLWEPLDLDEERLQRWQGINAAARMAEGLASRALFEVWERCAPGGRRARASVPRVLNERAQLLEDPGAGG